MTLIISRVEYVLLFLICIRNDIVDVSSSTVAFNVAKIAPSARSLTISLSKSLCVAGPLVGSFGHNKNGGVIVFWEACAGMCFGNGMMHQS